MRQALGHLTVPTSGQGLFEATGPVCRWMEAQGIATGLLTEKLHQPWIDDCLAQVASALAAVDDLAEPGAPNLLLGRLTHADVVAFVAERLARGLGIDTEMRTPRLRALTRTLADQPAFRTTEP